MHLASRREEIGTVSRVILESVQAADPQPSNFARLGRTGFHKRPVGRAHIDITGVVGDVVVDTKVHGGPDQAIYVYARDDYAEWARQLDREFPPGLFGENLTFSTMGDRPVRVGDRYRIGAVLLEVTAPRVPCNTFREKMGEPDWVRRFRVAGRPGYYCRVLSAGDVADGDPVERVAAPEENITADEMVELFLDRSVDPQRIRAALNSPVSVRAREFFERRLGRSENPGGGVT